MKRIATAAVIAALVTMAVPAAPGTEPPGPCCACLPNSFDRSSTNGPEGAVPAFFCSQGMTAEAEVRCGEIAQKAPDTVLRCLASVPGVTASGSSCSEQLAGKGIICPAAGAPAAAPLGLGLLALTLTGLGTVVLWWRSSRPRA